MLKISRLALLFQLLLLSNSQRFQQSSPASAAIEANRYYAVLLSNGSVYFGHLEGLGSPFPVLRDVYYVQSNQNPETKAVTSILVKRGKEWHGPDRMVISDKAIVFVEPVGKDSKVEQLIGESKRQQ
jgi:hypothetical protein